MANMGYRGVGYCSFFFSFSFLGKKGKGWPAEGILFTLATGSPIHWNFMY